MKVSESDTEFDSIPGEHICDFCGNGYDCLWALNDGLWAVCGSCMTAVFGGEEE